FLGAFQGCCAGWLGAATKLRVIALEPELLVDLRSRAMHQNQLHTQGGKQRQVLNQRVKYPVAHELAAKADHKGLTAEIMDVGGDFSKPSHELGRCKFGGDLC